MGYEAQRASVTLSAPENVALEPYSCKLLYKSLTDKPDLKKS